MDAGLDEEDLAGMLEQVLGGTVDDIGVEAHRHRDLAALLARGVQGGGGCEDGDEGNEDEEDEEDNEWDLQAGHGTHVAGMIYGRMLLQGAVGTASRREKFRRISGRWHRFFGLGAADAKMRLKRKAEEFEVVREEAKRRRMGQIGRASCRERV